MAALSKRPPYFEATSYAPATRSRVLDSCPGRATFHVAFRVSLLPWRRRPFYVRLPVVALLYVAFGLW